MNANNLATAKPRSAWTSRKAAGLQVGLILALGAAMQLCGTWLAAAEPGSAPAKPASAATRPQAKRFVAIFDLACPDAPQFGRQMAHSIRTRLARDAGAFDVIDQLTLDELAPKGGMPLTTDEKQIRELLAKRLGANAALWGDLQVRGEDHRLTVRYLDAAAGGEPVRWEKVFTDGTERARGVIALQVVEAIRGQAEWKPPEYGDEAEPADLGKPLNANGGFDEPGFHPQGWDKLDGVSTRLIDCPDRGRVLRVYTNLDREQWRDWQHNLRLGQADPTRPPEIPPSKDIYANVGGMEGVALFTDWLPARPGWRYWLVADVKGKTTDLFFPQIFVKGYADFAGAADALSEVSLHERDLTPASFAALPKDQRDKLIAEDAKAHPERYRREVYRWYLACRNLQGDWKHHAAPFPPRGGLPANVKYLRVEAYAYWPLGEYLFDNVNLYLDPRQKAPLAEEKARTESFRPAVGDGPTTMPARP